MNRFITGAAMAALLLGAAGSASAADWFPISVEVWDPPFDMASPRSTLEYVPLEKASQPWEICVSFPHMKDAYWLAVDYGVAEEAKRLGVRMQLLEAGGYTELNSQISQIEDCVAALKNVKFTADELSQIDLYAKDGDINLWAASSAG